nr:MAG TPA: hypothetical protein [Caudoviricetes sp.]
MKNLKNSQGIMKLKSLKKILERQLSRRYLLSKNNNLLLCAEKYAARRT